LVVGLKNMSASRHSPKLSGGRHRKNGSNAASDTHLLDQFGPIALPPVSADYVDRLTGSLAAGPDMPENWKKEHRKEGKRDR
jgi:hypothetical protein